MASWINRAFAKNGTVLLGPSLNFLTKPIQKKKNRDKYDFYQVSPRPIIFSIFNHLTVALNGGLVYS